MKYGQRWRDAPEYHLLDRVPLGRPCPPPIYTPSPLHPFSSPVDNFRSCIFSITRLGWMDLDSFPILPDSPIISIILELDVWRRRTFLVILSWLVLINRSKKIFSFFFFYVTLRNRVENYYPVSRKNIFLSYSGVSYNLVILRGNAIRKNVRFTWNVWMNLFYNAVPYSSFLILMIRKSRDVVIVFREFNFLPNLSCVLSELD